MWREEIEELLGTPAEDIPRISAKAGINVEAVLQQVVEQVPPPKGNRAPAAARAGL